MFYSHSPKSRTTKATGSTTHTLRPKSYHISMSYTIFILSAICALFQLFRFQYPDFHLYSWFLFFSYDIPFISLVLFISYPDISDPDPDFDLWHMILWLLLVLLLFILISGFKYFPSFSDSIPTHFDYFMIPPELLWHSAHMTLHVILSAPIYLSPLWSWSIPTLYK